MPEKFESYAQNREDVVLWRALHEVRQGVYVEVGANHPSWLSVTKAFYDLGWRGMTVEPVASFATLHRETRPGDVLVEKAISSRAPEPVVLHQIEGSGLSTTVDTVGTAHAEHGWSVADVEVPTARLDDVLAEAGFDQIHFMTVDVEGAEADVLSTLDLRRFRPWVLVVESTAPLAERQTQESWEPAVLAAGYEFCLFDGLSRFYVAEEHARELREPLSHPACVFDGFRDHVERDLDETVDRLRDELSAMTTDAVRWRATALQRWSAAAAGGEPTPEQRDAVAHLTAEIDALHRTVSWRVTAPLRAVRSRRANPVR